MFHKTKHSKLPFRRRQDGTEKELKLEWHPIAEPSTQEELLSRLLDLYWNGVRREVWHILLSLFELQKLGRSDIEREEEDNGGIEGYGTFMDQICFASRKHAEEYMERRWREKDPFNVDAARRIDNQLKAEKSTTQTSLLKSLVEQRLKDKPIQNTLHKRARLLLQSAGFLDIDKLVEPGPHLELWNKPGIPQLELKGLNADATIQFGPAHCKLCNTVLRGIIFRCETTKCNEVPPMKDSDSICEDCFRQEKHARNHLVKHYKHCVLQEAITPELSRKLCRCTTIERTDLNGNYISLFPVDEDLEHRTSAGFQSAKCRLLQLRAAVAEAKHKETQSLSSRWGLKAKVEKDSNVTARSRQLPHLDTKLVDDLDQDIPLPMRGYAAEKFPLGKAHIALMVGPLIIENGAPNSKGGVLIQSRDPFHYFVPIDPDDELPNSIALRAKDGKRELLTQYRSPRTERRVKACMKQVVSGVFSGFSNQKLEEKIISNLVEECALLPSQNNNAHFTKMAQNAVTRIHTQIRQLLEARAQIYLEKISKRLFDPKVELRWRKIGNNCQQFSDNILLYEDFGPIFALTNKQQLEPLYLMSFVCRPEAYHRAVVQTKYDVPNGLTEEYVLRYRSGRHDEADIVDSLSEYWHDWGAFGGHLYKHQDVFPWDCTEAYGKHPTRCNDCNIAKHVWAYPFDSWSISQLHMQKDRHWYQPTVGNKRVTDKEWMGNRLKTMMAQDVLLRGAVAMARTSNVRAACKWIHKKENARFDRLRLGGIHRAQPCSHHYEQRRYIEWYTATWAHLKRDIQIKAYEKMRDYRINLQEVPKVDSSDSGPPNLDAIVEGFFFGVTAMALPGLVAIDVGSSPAPAIDVPSHTSETANLTSFDGGSYGGNSFDVFGF